jgi:hypothetical protein
MIIAMRSGRKDRHWAVALGYTVGCTARWMWERRLEIALFVGALAIYVASTQLPVWIVAPIWTLTVAAIALDVRRGNRFFTYLTQRLFAARLRRKLVRAGVDSGVPGLKIDRIESTLPGELVDVYVPRGLTVERLDKASDSIAGCLRVSGVHVLRDREDRSHAKLSIVRRDTFAQMGGAEWPLMDAESVDIRRPFPAGQDEYGRNIDWRLLSRNLILGGSPDAGKSAALRVPIAAAALDPSVRLWLMDAKTDGAEFVHWAPAAHRLIRGRQVEEAVEVLAELEQRVEARYREIVARGEVFVCDDMEIDVLMIDEMPQFMRIFETDSKAQQAAVKTIRGAIWKLIAVGRAAGMMTVVSAQKPTADIVPSESRDLIDHKFALHCNTRAMSDAVLGAGAGEEAPANAADIPSGQPGVGYYVGDGGVQKMRSFFISHKQAMAIASRAAGRQMDAELEAMA